MNVLAREGWEKNQGSGPSDCEYGQRAGLIMQIVRKAKAGLKSAQAVVESLLRPWDASVCNELEERRNIHEQIRMM